MTKQTAPLNFIIPLVIYPFDVIVSIGETDDALFKTLKKRGVDISDANIQTSSNTERGKAILFKGLHSLIRMYERRDTPEWYGFLAHEIFHCVEFIMDRIGMKLTIESDEAYTYLIGYVTTEIYKKIK